MLMQAFKRITIAALFATASLCAARAQSADLAVVDRLCNAWGAKLADIAKAAKSDVERDQQIKTTDTRLESDLLQSVKNKSLNNFTDSVSSHLQECLSNKANAAFRNTMVILSSMRQTPQGPPTSFGVTVKFRR